MSENIFSLDITVPQIPEEKDLTEVNLNLRNEIKNITDRLINLQESSEQPLKSCDVISSSCFNKLKYDITQFLLEDADDLHLPESKIEAYVDLYKLLLQHNEQLRETLKYLKTELAQEEAELAELEQDLKCMQMEDESEEISDSNAVTLKQINEKISQKFVELKTDLHKVLNTFYSENFKNLVQELTAAYFGGTDKYIEIDAQVDMTSIALLHKASLIITDHHNPRRIRFNDIAFS